MSRYENKPGAVGDTKSVWPVTARLVRSSAAPTLLMFVHEECPCTRASLEELGRLVARCQGKPKAIVAFVKEGVSRPVIGESLLDQARRIPGLEVETVSVKDAVSFGATTSGFTALYDRFGKLLFCGGITEERGHEGTNTGSDAIISWVQRGESPLMLTPTYGCSIFDPSKIFPAKAESAKAEPVTAHPKI